VLRWRLACLVSAAIALSYLDRQTLPVAIKAIERDIPITNEQFSFLQSSFLVSYALMYAGGGRLVDVLGTRTGFLIVMIFWSLACASHGLATGVAMLAVGFCSALAKVVASRQRRGRWPNGSRYASAPPRWESSTRGRPLVASSRRR
jgi:sugar phosphate permease